VGPSFHHLPPIENSAANTKAAVNSCADTRSTEMLRVGAASAAIRFALVLSTGDKPPATRIADAI